MFALRGSKPQRLPSVSCIYCFVLIVAFCFSSAAWGQDQSRIQTQEQAQSEETASLQGLLNEAEQNNPQIRAARQNWEAAKQVPSQVSALPDPQAVIQQFSVGSPRPFAGYTNSDFAYIGVGVSQDLPYPGKLKLKGEIATQDANVAQQQYESVRRSVLANVKAAYFQLAYLSSTLGTQCQRFPDIPGIDNRDHIIICGVPIGPEVPVRDCDLGANP